MQLKPIFAVTEKGKKQMNKYTNADEQERIMLENEMIESNDWVEVVRCKDCKHSIKKDYDGVVSYEYLCILKSTVTRLEEHEANYFCADGERKETE